MESLKDIYDIVKSDFCNLMDYKLRGSTLEIITGIPTINQSFVSVFVSWDGEKYVASDGGWIDENMYESPEIDDQEIVDRLSGQYASYFDIKFVNSKSGILFSYKTCYDIKHVSAMVHDVGHYISLVVNIQNSNFFAAIEETNQRKQFQSKINHHLKKYYGERNVSTNETINLPDSQRLKMSAVVRLKENNRLRQFYLMYVTGNRKDVFIKDATRATINFKIIEDSFLNGAYYQRLAVVNLAATGYSQAESGIYLKELTTFSDRKPIYVENEDLLGAFSDVMPLQLN